MCSLTGLLQAQKPKTEGKKKKKKLKIKIQKKPSTDKFSYR
jgi:hypothetical protein